MRFGIWPASSWSWQETLAVARHCEQTGWDSVYLADHFMPNSPGDDRARDGDSLECWSMLAALAAEVPRVRLAPLVASVTYRHPAVLANMAAAVDHISGGRLTLGVGAGWQANEHAAYGLELGSVKERLDRFEEACEVISSMLSHKRTTFSGRYFSLRDAPNQPPPVQEKLPLLIGGGGERRTMRIAARYADEWNTWTVPDVLARKVSVLERHCEDVDRDPGEIHVSTQALVFLSADAGRLEQIKASDLGRAAAIGTPAEMVDIMGAYADAGADEFIVPGFTIGDDQRARLEVCDLFIEEVAPAFRRP
jgi:F420-dependent oxidoreductase-like protein